MKRWVVRLEAEERAGLEQLVRSGKVAALRIRHANILLAVDESDGSAKLNDTEAASADGAGDRIASTTSKLPAFAGPPSLQRIRGGVTRTMSARPALNARGRRYSLVP